VKKDLVRMPCPEVIFPRSVLSRYHRLSCGTGAGRALRISYALKLVEPVEVVTQNRFAYPAVPLLLHGPISIFALVRAEACPRNADYGPIAGTISRGPYSGLGARGR